MEIQEQVALGPLTTLGVGGPARYFAAARTESDIHSALEFAREEGPPLFVLGGGSNLVVGDEGWPGLVLKIEIAGINVRTEDGRTLFEAGAGEDWDTLVALAVAENCAGIECLSGIPGTVGGTPVQNVGAYGQDVSETIIRVRAIEARDGSVHEFTNSECGFAYRTSRFNTVDRGRFIITRVTFSLAENGRPKVEYADLKKHFAGQERPTLAETREAVRAIRYQKAMLVVEGDDDARSAGSFFKNPVIDVSHYERIAAEAKRRGLTVPKYSAGDMHVKVPAAWLVEQSGIQKGFTLGRVGISRRHTLAIVNRGGANAADVLALKELVQQRVREKFGIELQPEPVFVGVQPERQPLTLATSD
ncbi:MAG TPA: UDP-N-acetylmuramate dehydrogenase [Clostridia bacterium]|nr:UDP-N-acetylmuramate dehydrogenase [Clostridia bacterium]